MTALKVIGVILLILLLIACVRVRALARFGEKTELTLFIGPFRMTLLPEKEKKSAPDEEKKSGGEEKAKDAGKKKQRKLPKLTRAEKKELIRVVLAALRETARRACKRLCIDPLELLVVFGGEDPADIAQHYGYANALMWGVMPQLEDLFRIPDPSLHLRMDYSAKETRAEGTIGLSMRVWDGLFIACALLAPLLKWYRRFRKAHKGDKAESSTAESAEKSETQDGKLTA